MLKPLLRVPGYSVNLEYRLAPARAVVHETDSELIYIIDGKGTMTTGGTLINPQRQNSQNLAGTGIAGGTAHTLGKGDFLLLQNGTTHSFTAIDGELIVISMRLPAPSPQ
jgi:quercetin dioxygenase-like cupin family protein